MRDVLCFGNLQFDVLCHPVVALPAPGELSRLEGIDLMLSGNGGNVAAVLGRLGVGVDLAGYRGADPIGEAFVGDPHHPRRRHQPGWPATQAQAPAPR